MQLNITTDYAIRMVCTLGDGNTKTLDEIAEVTKIPRAYMGKLVRKLKAGGLLGSAMGPTGGVYLKRTLSEIRMSDIFVVMELTMKINRCLEDDAYCSRNKSATCPVRKYYQYIQEKLETEYLAVSLEEIIKGRRYTDSSK
ncbi:RrF2 family transcriptional regulator [Sellimonas intestinalis]|uniref:RrF2 family transcriptional regulator n=1 Tax=Sellimonas intestinalis TaxID=1653434 RepID=UPI0015EC7F53|nr:Rrf2 family transcriptional regulator [Sellimonas intestinalis]MBA2214856.1 Rrf2 family transcriptional regulator [Sellimonas intestinalis]